LNIQTEKKLKQTLFQITDHRANMTNEILIFMAGRFIGDNRITRIYRIIYISFFYNVANSWL